MSGKYVVPFTSTGLGLRVEIAGGVYVTGAGGGGREG